MALKKKLFGSLPPGVDKRKPEIIVWRQDQHEAAIEHLFEVKLNRPTLTPSLTKAAGVLALYALGLAGLLSPERIDWLIGLLPR